MGWPVQAIKKLTSSKDFVYWKWYFRSKPNDFNPLFYYLAALIAEVAKGHTKGKKGTRLEERLIQFVFQKKGTSYETRIPETEAEAKRRNMMSKKNWLSRLGIPFSKLKK